ncbi:Hemolysin, contains CBS domains [Arthrobacter subterraneus]|uniref:Hemolysin, contains CBS domains n=1 Tax=Arthrobacter subterraneus TaxID=335973 RepID=A0A1G8ND67_9MICC|nr:hemolysin family protein [Arthrobacter subterraneus]SDI78075.1 Hemolysin, contains CBS domains [Arthrobacter subterraneus]
MIEAVLTLLLGIIVILAIIAANGYFVAQEFAYMSVDRASLGARAAAGDKAAQRALKVTRRTSFMLSGAQLGITVTGLLIGYVAEPLVGESLGVLLGGAGVPAALSISVGTVSALVVAAVVQMIFGELYPKNLAIANAEPLARALARSTTIYLALFGWLITVFDHAANALLRAVRVEPVHDVDTSVTAEDLERIVADSRESGDLPEELSVLIDRILDFPDRNVEHAMIPRSQVGTVTPDTTMGQLRALMAQEHTRYPVISETEEPLGVVQLTDLLRSRAPEEAPVSSIMVPPLVLPTLMSLPDALAKLTRSRNELACIIDEYGGFAGVLTVEDLSEELVGELTDEHDGDPPAVITPEQENTWRMSGDIHVDEVERAVGYELPAGDYETISGLLIAHRGELPVTGEVLRVELPDDPRDLVLDRPVHRVLEVEVLELSRHVPSELLVRLVRTAADGAGCTDEAAIGTEAETEEDR